MPDFSSIKKLYKITKINGFSLEEIKSIENIYFNIPKVLKDYYLELGGYEDINQTQDSLLMPKDFLSGYFNNDNYMIIYAENQRVCFWAIDKNDLAKDNPPVYISYDMKLWELESENLECFLKAISYLQAVFALEFEPHTYYEIEKSDLDYIRVHYKNKEVYLKNWTGGIEFYGNTDNSIIVVMGGGLEMIYSSNNKEEFEKMDKDLSKLGISI